MPTDHRRPTASGRHLLLLAVLATLVLLATTARTPTQAAPAAAAAAVPAAQPDQAAQPDRAAAIVAIMREVMATNHLRAAIVRVTIDGEEVVTAALGESITGVPATTDMHFRNGSVAISYVATLLLTLVDDGVVGLDDPLSLWLPELPESDHVTLRMLANMTAGYQDYVPDESFQRQFYADPFRQWTPEELVTLSLAQGRVFAPGTNWDYAHANYVILGLALEKATGRSVADLMQERVLGPLGLTNTVSSSTPAIPEPVLHAFSSERRAPLGIPPGTRFYEESTYWNPSWSITHGAVQTTNIYDMAASAIAIGEGTLLSPASYQAMVAPTLLGFGSPLAGCRACHTLSTAYNYGLGVILRGNWLLQSPLFAAQSGVMAYLPTRKIAIALVVTYDEQSFDDEGNFRTATANQQLFTAIGAYLAPEDVPPSGI